MIGTTFSHYRVTAKLGQGGMGEVYRATDTKLDREVAIKVLPAVMATDQERLARFEREAKVLAQLSHANIATVHGFDHHEGTSFLVMEHVTGVDLSERLRRGPLPVEEAIEIGQQIAEALEAAHARGIVHRDLKPANIKVTAEGHVKVLDFGLAKALEADSELGRAYPRSTTAAGDGSRGRSPHLEDDSPTITDAFTKPGTILGTAAYMSPEQAKGKSVDGRTDIWAFGCVLFECLAGQRAFPGSDATDLLAGILKDDPDWDALPETTPVAVRLLLRKCLNKDLKRRLLEIGDARIDIEVAVADLDSSFSTDPRKSGPSRSPLGIPATVGIGLVMLGLGVIATLGLLRNQVKRAPSEIRQLDVDLGIRGGLILVPGPAVRISPDGSMMAYVGSEERPRAGEFVEDEDRLYIRRLDQLYATAIPDTERVQHFCFSPASDRIAFVSDGKVRAVSLTGQDNQLIGEVESVSEMVWGADGYLVFGSSKGGLRRLSVTGGNLETLTELALGESAHTSPHMAPDGRTVFYRAVRDSTPFVMAKRLPDDEPRLLVENAYSPAWMDSGQLLYVSEQQLVALPVDLESLQPTGTAKVIVEEVVAEVEGRWVGHFDVSRNGHLVYLSGPFKLPGYRIEWVDRTGARTEVLPEDRYLSMNLSPDGTKLLYGLNVSNDGNVLAEVDIWMADLIPGGGRYALVTENGIDMAPVWSPQGDGFMYSRQNDGTLDLTWMSIEQSGRPQLFFDSEALAGALSWHPSGEFLVYSEIHVSEGRNSAVRIASIQGDAQTGQTMGEIQTFLETALVMSPLGAAYSPDGQWFAFVSNKHGGERLYVTRFPGSERGTLVSGELDDVQFPVWSKQNHELLFATGTAWGVGELQIYSVKWRVEDGEFRTDPPQPWLGATTTGLHLAKGFQIHPDGDRVLVRTESEDTSGYIHDHVVLFENFGKYLQGLGSATK